MRTFTYPPETGPNRYRFTDVLLAAHGPGLAAERIEVLLDFASDALTAEQKVSLEHDRDRFTAMQALIVG